MPHAGRPRLGAPRLRRTCCETSVLAMHMTTYQRLLDRFAHGDVTCGVVGLGYVGLPLAVEMGKAGLRVVGFEKSARVADLVNRGESHIKDVAPQDVAMLRHRRLLEATIHGHYFADCTCGWSGGVHDGRARATAAWQAHRDGTASIEPVRPTVVFAERPHGQAAS